jgi:tetratricopeptide (TPR) repeat protein
MFRGNPNNANIGDPAGAIESYRKALTIIDPVVKAQPADSQAVRSLGIIYGKLSETQGGIGDIAGSIENAQRSLEIFKMLAKHAAADIETQQDLAIRYIKLGDVLGNPNFPNASEHASAMVNYQNSSAILETLDSFNPGDQRTRRLLGIIHERVGTLQELEGNLAAALDTYLKSLVLREALPGTIR